MSPYPLETSQRNAWVVGQRGVRNAIEPNVPYAFLSEREPDDRGQIVTVSTIFLTNRECPWKCVYCDLWKNTLTERVPLGAIPAQVDHALARLPAARHVKLYNSGSFFDSQAIPPETDEEITKRVARFD